ncbi:hypothetical protein VTJ04DRAFT_9389 [Mycothermus thermophilus]|uniref:uncharacterized protein n=1 Tax=Humicola insolens TaxID=85995 RepID=UPI00374391AE
MKRNRGRPDASDNTSSPREPASAAPTRRSKPISEHEPQRHPSSPEPAPPGATTGATHNNENNYTPFLTTLTRSIPRSTIASKWTPLDAPSISAIEAILTDCTLPILHRLRDRDARYAQAQSILTTFSARLRSKLAKGMPFPPPSLPATSTSARGRGSGKKGAGAEKAAASHAAEFDFEQTVAAIAGLERALDPLLHSVELLKAEKEREERALERDYAALRELEGNARAQARGWKEGEGKGRDHPLAAGVGGGAKSNGGLEVVVPKGEEVVVGGVFKDLQDEEELLALSQQISSHMESMQNNLGQIQGILPAIAKSRAALQGTLCEYLDPEQYEQVVLG